MTKQYFNKSQIKAIFNLGRAAISKEEYERLCKVLQETLQDNYEIDWQGFVDFKHDHPFYVFTSL